MPPSSPPPRPSTKDLLTTRALLAVRHVNRRAIQEWSRSTWVPRWAELGTTSTRVVPARTRHGDDLPEGLFVAHRTPTEGRLGMLYVLPYYGLASIAFRLHRRFPIDRAIPWQPDAPWEPRFPDNGEGWRGGRSEEDFVALRLSGPNPFLLRREDERTFVLDLDAPFAGTGRGAIARFTRTERGIAAASITLRPGTTGEHVVRPGEPDFVRAARVVDALDARYAVFAQHLGTAHLLLAQAFALAATALPRRHPLHGVLLAHVRGTLEVNEFAYELLLSPSSYFAQSGFADRELVVRLLATRLASFRLEEAIVPLDLARRGVSDLVESAYVVEATAAWNVLLEHSRESCERLYASDDALRADADLARFRDQLVRLLPSVPADLRALETREALATWLAILLFLNPMHEVSGDYSPFALARDAEQKRLVRWSTVEDDAAPITFHDVLLFEQGAYTGLANAAGNSMLDAPIERDPRLGSTFVHGWITRLRERLRALDVDVRRRNAARERPLRRMEPRHWELSVSF